MDIWFKVLEIHWSKCVTKNPEFILPRFSNHDFSLPPIQEDDGLRMKKSNLMSSQHSSMGMKKDEGLSARTMALIVLFFVVGVIVGKLVL